MIELVRWEDPPPERRGGSRRDPTLTGAEWAPVVDVLKAHPGRWAVIHIGEHSPSNLVSAIRYGRLPVFAPAGTFDATARSAGGVKTVYARFIGDGAA